MTDKKECAALGSGVTLTPMKGADGYEVRRDGVLVGQVKRHTFVATTRRSNSATLRKTQAWRFQVVGRKESSFDFDRRKDAVKSLCSHFDAVQAARKAVTSCA